MFSGAYRAKVVNNKDPEERGRLIVQCPKVYGDYDSPWCLPCSPLSITEGGQFTVPSAGDMVMLIFEENSEECPVWLGCMWKDNSTGLPQYQPDRYKQVIKTKKGHYILIDDEEDKIMIIHKDKHEIFIEPTEIRAKHKNASEVVIDESEIRMKHNNGNIGRVHNGGSELKVSSGAGIEIDNSGTVNIIGSTINFLRL